MSTHKNFASDVSSADLTPAMAQYVSLKKAHSECLLFFQMGDFYELFFEDAILVARLLELTLTQRGKVRGKDIPMCGVPMRAGEVYIARLLHKGYKVALCAQTEVPSGKPKLLKREVARIFTPGTSLDEAFLSDPSNNFLMVVAPPEKNQWAVALADVSTGALLVESVDTQLTQSQLLMWNPKEIVVPFECFEDERLHALKTLYKGRLSSLPMRRFKNTFYMLEKIYGVAFDHLWNHFSDLEKKVAEALADYLYTLLQQTPALNPPISMKANKWMRMDFSTRKSLELMTTLSGEYQGSLFSVINHTITASGQRLLAQRLATLPINLDVIQNRHRAVDFFVQRPDLLKGVRGALDGYGDLERALARLSLGHKNPKDLGIIRDALGAVQRISKIFAKPLNDCGELSDLTLDIHANLLESLENALMDFLPRTFEGGSVIRQNFDPVLDDLSHKKEQIQKQLAQLERDYQERLNIDTLKIKQNNLIGFYIDIAVRHREKVPAGFHLKQGLSQSARYITQELTDIVGQLDGADEAAMAREHELFEAHVQKICSAHKTLAQLAVEVAILDVTTALADVAREHDYVLPSMTLDRCLSVRGGRHPVIEHSLRKKGHSFEKNDCTFDAETTLALITGPNMAGKSTYLRQNALIVIMAHLGSFVPAERASMGVVDALFSRVGASDNLLGGESTFMVEMKETAHILHDATPNSFVIIDEVGRGTSTQDGVSIASACVDYLAHVLGCRTLFSTHYFELTKLAQKWPQIACLTLDVRSVKDHIVFLHKIVPGFADHSYGIEVARLAGLPEEVLRGARAYLEIMKTSRSHDLSVIENLRTLDLETLTAKQSLDTLFRLKELVNKS